MRVKNSEEVAKLVCHSFEKVFFSDRKKTRDHFVLQGMYRTTINRILDRYEDRKNSKYKIPPGRPVRQQTKTLTRNVEKVFRGNPNISERAAATKLKISKTYLHDIKANKIGLKTYKAKTAPKYNEGQKKRAKTNCRKLVEKMLTSTPKKIIVMDDETYCPVDPESVNGVKFYSCRSKKDIDPKYKLKPKEKFPKKYMIWLAIDENGNVSKPFITTKNMNSELYLKECIIKRLIPFIKNKKVLFWPDMASCHYAKKVTAFLREKKVDFVEKKDNAPNVPQCRPIEKFWALIKKEYSKKKRAPKNFEGFRRAMQKIIKDVAEKSGKELMRGVRQSLRSTGKEGVFGALKD